MDVSDKIESRGDKDKNLFERNPKKTLSLFLIVVFGLMVVIPEWYLSFKSKAIKKDNSTKRYIALREHSPFTDKLFSYNNSIKVLLRTDDDGFIIPSKIHINPDISIVFFGGSTTESMFVDEKSRFSYLSGRVIEKELNKKVNTYNSGFFGNNSMHSNFVLLSKVVPLKPDIAVMKHNINDLVFLLYFEDGYWNKHRRQLFEYEEDIKTRILGFGATNKFAAFMTALKDVTIPNIYEKLRPLKLKLNYRLDDKIIALDEFEDIRGKKKIKAVDGRLRRDDEERILNRFKSSLQTFVSICNAWGIRPVLMTQANRLKTIPDAHNGMGLSKLNLIGMTYKEFKSIYDLFNETIREVAEKNDVLLIDLAKMIPQEKEYMYDLVHLNVNGSKLVAEVISKELLKIL